MTTKRGNETEVGALHGKVTALFNQYMDMCADPLYPDAVYDQGWIKMILGFINDNNCKMSKAIVELERRTQTNLEGKASSFSELTQLHAVK